MLYQGALLKKTVTKKNEQFSLKGMINPSFQNVGTAIAYIDGREVPGGETFNVNLPLLVLQNDISIDFEADPLKTKIVYVHYGEKVKTSCP